MALPTERCQDIIKLYYETKSVIAVTRRMKKMYPGEKRVSRLQVSRIVKRFEQHGSVLDQRHSNKGRPRSSRSDENLAEVKQVIDETPQKSVRNVLSDITNSSSVTSVYRALKFDLKLTPYAIPVLQHLKDSDINHRIEFAIWISDNVEILNDIWFSDESHFFLDQQVNKQNHRYWSDVKPCIFTEKTCHAEKVTVWAAISTSGIIGPFFFQDQEGNAETINSERYLTLLKRQFLPSLRRRGFDLAQVWFQQDGAAPHTAQVVLEWLRKQFDSRFISLKTDRPWPPHSPDLSPLDFFLWGHLKDRVYLQKPTSTDELKQSITREMRKITSEMCQDVINNFMKRVEMVRRQNGRHFEYMM